MKSNNIHNVQEIGFWDNGSKNGVDLMNHERYFVDHTEHNIFFWRKKIIRIADKAPHLQ